MLDLTCGSIRNGREVVCSFNVSSGASSGQGRARDVRISKLQGSPICLVVLSGFSWSFCTIKILAT